LFKNQKNAERVFAGLPKEADIVINIPPGTTKSTIVSIMYPAWIWTRMPHAKIISGAYAHPLALEFSRKSRLIIQSSKYLKLFPHVVLSMDQNTKTYYVNTAGGSRKAVGTNGAIGFHAHFLLVDDPLDPQEISSDLVLASANTWMFETLTSRKIDKNISLTILVMQRLHENDPTGYWLDLIKQTPSMRVKHICLPAKLPENNSPSDIKVLPVNLTKYYQNGYLDNRRLNQDSLDEAYIKLGSFTYSCQFDQSPIPRGGSLFKTSMIEVVSPPLKFIKTVRYWDKAGTKNAGCKTAGVKMGKDADGYIWILDVVLGQWGAYERERIIKQTAEMDGKSTIIGIEQEPGSGGLESAQNTVRNLSGFNIVVDIPKGDKLLRADPFAVQVNGGNVKMARGSWNLEYINELRYFPASKYKDQVDATSGAFAIVNKRTKRAGGLW